MFNGMPGPDDWLPDAAVDELDIFEQGCPNCPMCGKPAEWGPEGYDDDICYRFACECGFEKVAYTCDLTKGRGVTWDDLLTDEDKEAQE